MMELDAAYRTCEGITWSEAKNFAYGIRLLPPPKRRAMAALYAFARRIDDVGDGDMPAQRKLDALAGLRSDIDALVAGTLPDADDAVYVGLLDAASQFPIPLAAFIEIVEGCEHDTRGTEYLTIDDTVVYCRLVAGSVGRLSLGVFGTDDMVRGMQLADDLGVALQLTNILRDVVEDRGMGRVYLPAADIERFGCAPDLGGPRDAVAELVSMEATRAAEWFDRGLALLPMLDHRSRACVGAMSGIYHRLLRRIRHDPAAVLDGRLSVPPWEKAWVAARSLVGVPA